MSWVTILWSMLVGTSLTFALLHLFIGAKGIQRWANFAFVIAAVATAAITAFELMAMRATSTEQMAIILRWVHPPILILWMAIVCFVRFYFKAGRSWLAGIGAIVRVLAVILNYTTGQNLFFKEITGLKQVTVWGGETISIAEGILNPWYPTGPISTLLLAAFVLDAAIGMWRREQDSSDRRRALILSASIIFFLLTAVVHAALVNIGALNSPYLVGLSFMVILFAMSYELSCNMFHSVQMASMLQASEIELRRNKQRMKLAANAAELRLWEWDIVYDQIWSSDSTLALYGLDESRTISSESFFNIIYEEDRERVRFAIANSLAGNGDYECEFRIIMPDGHLHWFNSRGRIDFDDLRQPLRMQGVTIDITSRKKAKLEVQQQRNELIHLSRVTLLGELSGSLAHELNQPLTAILSNAQAAQRFLARDKEDLAEVENILNDIVAEDRRAGEIIHRLRQLLKKGETQCFPLDLNKVTKDVLKLVNSDLVNHNVIVSLVLDPNLPIVIGDRVQIQQVLLNLIMNVCEAMSQSEEGKRRLFIRTKRFCADKVQLSVADQGPGIDAESRERIFEPFFTTKLQGMGLGLTICRNIINSHGGRLWAADNAPNGTIFYFTLPIS
ncbi:MAG: sensor histidine kinase [Methylosarcina sp.]